MRLTDSPPPVTVPFAQNGSRTDLPIASQISVTKGAASFNDGFPPLTMTSPLKGGVPPFGADMNGILFALSQIARWLMWGGSLVYDAAFAADPNVGGYPKGAVLLRADAQGAVQGFWLNTEDNNATNPDASDGTAAGWVSLNADWSAASGPGAILNRPTLAKVTFSEDTALDATHAGMAIQWAGGDGYIILARTSSLPLNAVAFLIYHHGVGVLDVSPQSGDYLWMGGPDEVPSVVLQPGEFALCLSRVNGEYDVLVTRLPVNADWDAGSGAAQILNRPELAAVATSGKYSDLSGTPTIPAAQVNADWNATSGVAQILNKPSSLGGLSGLHIELGYQPNDRGVDKGDHYELDFTMATNAFGGFQFTVNGDNSISVPTGMYLVDADAEINAPVEDDWQIPAQMTFSVCNGYGYPGVYQQAVRRFPDLPLSMQKKGGTLGSLILAGPLWISAGDHVWAGFTKVLGANTQTPLMIRGRLSLTKVA